MTDSNPYPGPYYQQSECGQYTISKAYCGGKPIYTAWHGKQMLDSHLAYADAVANVREHKAQNSSE